MRGLLCVTLSIIGLACAEAASGQTVSVLFDIQPTSCPNTFDPPGPLLEITGTLPTAILGTDEVNARNLNTNSLVIVVPGGGGLRGDGSIAPTRTTYEDVATPVADPTNCGCTEDGPDGVEDLVITFDLGDFATLLGENCTGDQLEDCVGVQFPVCIEGLLLDGTPFSGCDCILIVGPVAVEDGSWGRTKSSYR